MTRIRFRSGIAAQGYAKAISDTIARDDRAWRALSLNGAIHLPLGPLSRRLDYNRAAVLRAQIPGVNLVATARSLAKLYASAVGDVDGLRALSPAALERATVEQSSGEPLFGFGLPGDARWGVGFQLSSPASRPMLGEASFGHDGAGGELAFGDSARKVGFAYVNNQMGILAADDRANGLVRALASCLS